MIDLTLPKALMTLFQGSSMPTDMDTAVSMALSFLSNSATRPVIVFIDALNQVIVALMYIYPSNVNA